MIDSPCLVTERPVAAFKVVGRHRVRFLNAMTSMGLMQTSAGDARFATMSTSNGKHIGTMRLEIDADFLTLLVTERDAERLMAGLTRHRIADDIRWTRHDGVATVISLAAPTDEALDALLARLPAVEAPIAVGRFVDVNDGSHTIRVTRIAAAHAPLGVPTVTFRALDGGDALALVAPLDLTALDENAAEALRVRALWPDDLVDLPEDEPTLASTRLVATVDWNKGCFLGQEVFVMARDRGEAPKRLVGFHLDGAAPEPGAEVKTADGKVAGRLGSVAIEGDGVVCLGLIKKRFADAEGLALDDGRLLQRLPTA